MTARSDDRPRTIRRYPNRRLFDVEDGVYVSLETVLAWASRGVALDIRDSRTGEPIATETLAPKRLH